MDRNSILGLVLIAVIIIGYSIATAPNAEEVEKAKIEAQKQAVSDSLAKVATVVPADSSLVTANDSTKLTIVPVDTVKYDTLRVHGKGGEVIEKFINVTTHDTLSVSPEENLRLIALQKAESMYGELANAYIKHEDNKARIITVENDKIKLWISTYGGAIVQAELKEYDTYNEHFQGVDEKLLLLDSLTSSFGINFIYNRTLKLSTSDLWFEPIFDTSTDSIIVNGEELKELKFRLTSSDSTKYIDFVYVIGQDYMIDFHIDIVGLNKEISENSIGLDWDVKSPTKEKLIDSERRLSTVMYKYADEDRSYLTENGDETLKFSAKTDWICFKEQYFSTFIIAPDKFSKDNSSISVTQLKDDSLYVKDFQASLTLPLTKEENNSIPLKFYFGPNQFHTLKQYDLGMERVINLGWGIFGWVNRFVVIPIFNWLASFGLSYGIIILLLTLIIKAFLFPLTFKNYKSSAKMRLLKPEIEQITSRYKDKKDRESMMKKQQETMGLYRKTGVNPMAGCVPMLLQMPILYAMFRFFPSAIELRQQGFLWADDLSAYDSVLDLSFNIPAYGNHVSLFTLLMCISTFFYTRLNSSNMTTSGPGMPNMKYMMYFFPVMMLFFFNNFSSGLSYYYLLANVISMAQMLLIKKYFIDEKALHLKIQENKNKKGTATKSKFQQRLEEAAKKRGYKK